MPSGIGASWPGKQSFIPTKRYRRKAKPMHPDCATDRKPHRELSRQWLKDRMPVALVEHLVRTRHEGDPLYIRALNVYRAMVAAMPEHLRPTEDDYRPGAAAFPITRQDMAAGSITVSPWLAPYDDTEDDDHE